MSMPRFINFHTTNIIQHNERVKNKVKLITVIIASILYVHFAGVDSTSDDSSNEDSDSDSSVRNVSAPNKTAKTKKKSKQYTATNTEVIGALVAAVDAGNYI